MQKLNISIIQTSLSWEDKAKNRTHFTNLIDQSKYKDSDIIILPEMFTTGFSLSASKLAEKMDGTTISWMKSMSAKYDIVVCGSIMIEEKNHYYNRFLWVEPNGRLLHYDKKHLFSYAGENNYFTAGENKLIIEYKGWRICPLVCYDLRFPEWARNKENYDLLIYVANWPAARTFAFESLLTARAIENQTYVAACNIIGKDGNNLSYIGHSSIKGYDGGNLLDSTKEEILHLTLDKEKQEAFRKEKPFLGDMYR